jgi:hypoxanthine-guanine phosphoribosyltransferase
MRRKTVRLKLNTIKSEFHGKNVLLIDDSIVRGTTSMELVQMARDAGAKKVRTWRCVCVKCTESDCVVLCFVVLCCGVFRGLMALLYVNTLVSVCVILIV